MIPPNASLLKYDNPVLVSRNTEKKTPKVIPVLIIFFKQCMITIKALLLLVIAFNSMQIKFDTKQIDQKQSILVFDAAYFF